MPCLLQGLRILLFFRQECCETFTKDFKKRLGISPRKIRGNPFCLLQERTIFAS